MSKKNNIQLKIFKVKKMKKIYLFGIPLIAVITGFILLGKNPDTNKFKKDNAGIEASVISTQKTNLKNGFCCTAESLGRYSDKSIYQLDAVWKDQNGKKKKLGSFKGRKVVLAMFYASCTSACPVLVGDIKNLEEAMSSEELKDYRFVLVSIDPAKDTPKVLKTYAEDHNLDLARWTLLTGSKDNVAALAQLLGFQYKRKSSGMFSHTNLITFLNEEGEIAKQSTGLLQSTDELLSIAASVK